MEWGERRILAFVTAISTRDAAALMEITHDGALADGYDAIPRTVLSALAELIPSDAFVGYNETQWAPKFRVTDEVPFIARPAPPSVVSAFPRFGWQNPLRNCLRRGEQSALRLSSFLTRRVRRRLEFDVQVWRPLGIEDSLSVWLPAPPGRARAIYLERSTKSYTDRDVTLLTLLRPHLIRMRVNAESRRTVQGRGLTAREAEVLGWIARGKRDTEIGELLFISPHTVGKHVEHIFEKLEVRSRAAAVGQVLRDVKLAPLPHDG